MFEDTQRLLERCIRQEEKAWGEFVERFSGLLYYSAQERLRRNGIRFGQQDLEDIVQGVFLEIWEKRRLEEVREREKITAWLSIVAQTRALNYMRQKKERLLEEEEFFKLDALKIDAESQGDDAAFMEELEKAIETLDAQEKIVLKLNIMHGKKHREIAQFMNIPLNTVSTIIARNKKFLEKKLKNLKENT
jgi:RNA polymerase sigma-70 factor (ECF subfamily)